MLFQIGINLAVMFVWALLNGRFNAATLLTGYLVGMALLFLFQRLLNAAPYYLPARARAGLTRLDYLRRFLAGMELVAVFFWEVVKANIQVAMLVLRPKFRARSGIIALPLAVQSDWQITLLANMITLTPGTITVHVDRERRYLYVHALDIDDPEALKQSIKETFERRILEVFG